MDTLISYLRPVHGVSVLDGGGDMHVLANCCVPQPHDFVKVSIHPDHRQLQHDVCNFHNYKGNFLKHITTIVFYNLILLTMFTCYKLCTFNKGFDIVVINILTLAVL